VQLAFDQFDESDDYGSDDSYIPEEDHLSDSDHDSDASQMLIRHTCIMHIFTWGKTVMVRCCPRKKKNLLSQHKL